MNGKITVKIIALTIWGLLLFSPFLFQDVRQIEVAARIAVFIVLVASYDLLIGYTGIVSFAHTMFFGFGAYGVAIAMKQGDSTWGYWIVGVLAGVLVSAIVAVLIGLLSLRVKAIFFAMITLAAASVALVLASQLSSFTGGEDGITYSVQSIFKPATKLLTDDEGKVLRIMDVRMNGKIAAYYFVFISCAVLFWAMLRIVASPRAPCFRRSARTRRGPKVSATASSPIAPPCSSSRRPQRRWRGRSMRHGSNTPGRIPR